MSNNRGMRLLVVSDMPHYLKDGKVAGWGPTVEEINHLSRIFDNIVHIGPLHKIPAPESSLPYTSDNIKLVAIPPAGGSGIVAKLSILKAIPCWVRTILKELKECDMVHIRCPANISLIAILLLVFLKYPKKRWVKYAGNWSQRNVPLFYYLQRVLLHHNLHRGVVTINGKWKEQKAHEISFLNPSMNAEEIDSLKKVIENKALKPPIRILFIGRLEEAKGPQHVIEACGILIKKGYDIFLDLAGDGKDRKGLESMAEKLEIMDNVHFCGWLPHPEVKVRLSESHFLILPSASEGWPKVLSEAFACGAYCIASRISSIEQILIGGKLGKILNDNSGRGIAEIIEELLSDPVNWKKVIEEAHKASREFTYEEYIKRVKDEVIVQAGLE